MQQHEIYFKCLHEAKELDSKNYMLIDSIYMAFWKMQNYNDKLFHGCQSLSRWGEFNYTGVAQG